MALFWVLTSSNSTVARVTLLYWHHACFIKCYRRTSNDFFGLTHHHHHLALQCSYVAKFGPVDPAGPEDHRWRHPGHQVQQNLRHHSKLEHALLRVNRCDHMLYPLEEELPQFPGNSVATSGQSCTSKYRCISGTKEYVAASRSSSSTLHPASYHPNGSPKLPKPQPPWFLVHGVVPAAVLNGASWKLNRETSRLDCCWRVHWEGRCPGHLLTFCLQWTMELQWSDQSQSIQPWLTAIGCA